MLDTIARVSRYIHTDVCETRQHCRDSREERTLVVAVPMRILSKLWLPGEQCRPSYF